ncbi:zinc finger protein 688-like [Pangshura tecta]
MAVVDPDEGLMSFEKVAVYFPKGQGALLDPAQRPPKRDILQENYGTVTSLGLPILKPALIARLEAREDPWVPDFQAFKESNIRRVTGTAGDIRMRTEIHSEKVLTKWNCRGP